MAFLWGAVVLISAMLNSYLSLPPVLNMIRLDQGFGSMVEAISSGDVALVASLTNAVLAITLLMRTIIVIRRWISGGGKQNGNKDKTMNGHGIRHVEPASGTSSFLGAFTILCIGLAGGYVASNTIIVNRHVSSTDVMHAKYNLALEEVAAAQRLLSTAHDGTEQCRVESADVLSELNGKLAARDATIDTCSRTASDASAVRAELDKVRAQLEEAAAINKHNNHQDATHRAELESKNKVISYLKSEMTAMGVRFGIKVGEIENSVFEAQENRRKMAVEKNKVEKELQAVQPEVTRLRRSQEGLEKKLKRETESHASTMDEYSSTIVRLGDVENAVQKFLKGESNEEGLRKAIG